MTPEERDRLVALEQQMRDMRNDVSEIKGDVRKLVNTYSMGEGAWKAIMRIGAIGTAIVICLAWLADHVPQWLHK